MSRYIFCSLVQIYYSSGRTVRWRYLQSEWRLFSERKHNLTLFPIKGLLCTCTNIYIYNLLILSIICISVHVQIVFQCVHLYIHGVVKFNIVGLCDVYFILYSESSEYYLCAYYLMVIHFEPNHCGTVFYGKYLYEKCYF